MADRDKYMMPMTEEEIAEAERNWFFTDDEVVAAEADAVFMAECGVLFEVIGPKDPRNIRPDEPHGLTLTFPVLPAADPRRDRLAELQRRYLLGGRERNRFIVARTPGDGDGRYHENPFGA